MIGRSLLYTLVAATFLQFAPFHPAIAAGPVFWEVSGQDDVAKGDAKGVSISENGTITLAPTYTLIYDTKEAYIWSSAADTAGNIYLGTGHEGRVFVVDSKGSGKMLYDSGELDVTALAADSQGNVFAGTSPDGKIYKITGAGAASVFFDPEDKYIWSLVYDTAASVLYAGTGAKGIIYKIDAGGKGEQLVDTNETNIVALALEKNGDLLAGTDPAGLVLRVSKSGKTFALFDSPMQEIHNIAIGQDGVVFALGLNQQAASQRQNTISPTIANPGGGEPVITISSEDEDEVQARSQMGLVLSTSQNRSGGRSLEGVKAALFRISAEAGSEVYWSSRDASAFGLRVLADGRAMVGTGQKGRIYAISPDRSPTLLLQSPDDQTSTIISVGDSLFATSSNLGRLYRIGPATVAEGVYLSSVRDAKFYSKWGAITWRGLGDVTLQSRTGNTESPDATWSDWSALYKNAAGNQIGSPSARFIQWRATLQNGAKAQLQAVIVAYLPRNQTPEVASVNSLPPGVALQELPSGVDPSILSSGLDLQLFGISISIPPRRFFQKGARSLAWQGSDPNDDSLIYKVFYRSVSESDWHLLADNLAQSYYTIDGNKLPDGSYVFKIRASDSPNNPAELALTNEATTEVVEIDNTPPAITAGKPATKGRSSEIQFDVLDSTSRVVKAEFSVDGGPWHVLLPVDGIPDSSRESFKVAVTFEGPGEHVVAIRAGDSNSNIGTAKATVTVQ